MREVFDWIRSGALACGDDKSHGDFCAILDTICNNGNGNNGDYYLLIHDFPDYCRAQDEVDRTYRNPDKWWRLSIKVRAAAFAAVAASDSSEQHAMPRSLH